MPTIAVASGKGGAGKTSLAAALAEALAPRSLAADCDVDAANGSLALGAVVRERRPYYAGPGFVVDAAACVACGACDRACRFSAIVVPGGAGPRAIIPELCERCGACLDACPAGAIHELEKQAGELFVSDTALGVPLVHADLVPGEDTSGKLVRAVRERAAALAEPGTVVVVDAPPGIGCPVIASLAGCDLVVVVVEAGASGIRDAARLVELASGMDRRLMAVINKTGLDRSMDEAARALAARTGMPIAGEIPFDPALRSLDGTGRTWLHAPGDAGRSVKAAIEACAEAATRLREVLNA